MKHVVWLLLAACCLAFGQVQPAASPAADGACGCCDCGGACGMPECAPPPVARTPVFAQTETRNVKAEATRLKAPARPLFAAKQPLSRTSPALGRALGVAHGLPVVDTPVFLVHCSLLI